VVVENLAKVVEQLLLDYPPCFLVSKELLSDIGLIQIVDPELTGHRLDLGHVKLAFVPEGEAQELVVEVKNMVYGVVFVLIDVDLMDHNFGHPVLLLFFLQLILNMAYVPYI
jgi:hypothetical protein